MGRRKFVIVFCIQPVCKDVCVDAANLSTLMNGKIPPLLTCVHVYGGAVITDQLTIYARLLWWKMVGRAYSVLGENCSV